jgi:hypothetical protein
MMRGMYVKTNIYRLNTRKLLGANQIPGHLIRAGDETVHSEVRELTHFVSTKKELPQQ